MLRLKKFHTNLPMIRRWKGLALEIAEIEYKHDRTPSAETIPTQTSKLKLIENINNSHTPTYDRSLERS